MTEAAISVTDLTKRFGDHLAVDSICFEVPPAAITGFIGGNGAGKTTTMRTMLGLTQPTSGTVTLHGQPYAELANPRLVVGSVLDRLGAHPGITGRRHLRIVAASATITNERVDTVLETVGLADAADRKLGTYSTGMQQRLALASALLAEPSILVLDEPARGLDPAGIRWLRTLLRTQADNGTAVFVSTHQLAELAEVVDHVVLIDRGQILAAEPAPNLLARTEQHRLEDAVFALTPN